MVVKLLNTHITDGTVWGPGRSQDVAGDTFLKHIQTTVLQLELFWFETDVDSLSMPDLLDILLSVVPLVKEVFALIQIHFGLAQNDASTRVGEVSLENEWNHTEDYLVRQLLWLCNSDEYTHEDKWKSQDNIWFL